MDHLLFYNAKPTFINYFLIAFLVRSKRSLLVARPTDFMSFFETQSSLNIKQTIKLAFDLQKKYEKSTHMGSYSQNMPLRLQNGNYESFQRYPEHFVNF
jgi:hypothetical protein